MIALGLDPSISAFGYGVLEHSGVRRVLLAAGTIRTKSTDPLERRLEHLGRELGEVIRAHHCERAGLEELRFVHAGERDARMNADNSKSLIAMGVAFHACQAYGCRVELVNPQRAKVAVLGPGGGHARSRPRDAREAHAQKMARKRAVRDRLARLLGVELDCSLDASDALAFAWLLTLTPVPVLR